MYVFANIKTANDFIIKFRYAKCENYEYDFVSQRVWDTENDFWGFKFPILVIIGIPVHPGQDSLKDFGYKNMDDVLVYRFSPRDMLTVYDYLQSIDYDWSDTYNGESGEETDEHSIIPINRRDFMVEFVRKELAKTEESKELQELMYSEVFLFFRDVFENYLKKNQENLQNPGK